jgi:hypothetical protein
VILNVSKAVEFSPAIQKAEYIPLVFHSLVTSRHCPHQWEPLLLKILNVVMERHIFA